MSVPTSACQGCRNDFYNGKNPLGVKECWSRKGAKMVTLYQIGWWTPMDKAENFRRVRKPDCWHDTGHVAVMKALPYHLRGQEKKVPGEVASVRGSR